MRYTFKQLEVFLAIANHQNVSAAAQELSMSQSAASESLKALESQFDIQLFDRIGKKLQLNELGKSVRSEASTLIERASNLELSLRQHARVKDLKVGATLSIGNYLAINMLSEFKQCYPSASIILDVANTTEIAERVHNFELDIGLIEGEVNENDLHVEPWRDDELVVFCSPSHPFANKPLLEDMHLRDAKWVLRESGSGTRQAFDYAMHGLISKLNIELELQHTEAIKRAVQSNIGIGCLSRITLEDAFKRGTLVPLSAPQRDFKRQLFIIQHRQKYQSAGMTAWLKICRDFTTHA